MGGSILYGEHRISTLSGKQQWWWPTYKYNQEQVSTENNQKESWFSFCFVLYIYNSYCLWGGNYSERQDNGDRRRLTHQHLSDLLRLLTHERDRRKAARSRRLNHSSPFRAIELSMCLAWDTWYASVYLVAWLNTTIHAAVRYQVDAQALLRITRHKSLENLSLLINAQHYSLFQITICHLLRHADDAYQGYLPSCKLHSHDSRSLNVRRYSMNVRRYRLQ